GNPEAARRAGINVTAVVVVLFMFSGALAALGGVIQAARLDAGPPNVGLLLALDAISAAVVGGTYLFGGQGTIGGMVTGTFFLASIQNGLNLKGVSTYWQYIVSGVILLAAGAVHPHAQSWRRSQSTSSRNSAGGPTDGGRAGPSHRPGDPQAVRRGRGVARGRLRDQP